MRYLINRLDSARIGRTAAASEPVSGRAQQAQAHCAIHAKRDSGIDSALRLLRRSRGSHYRQYLFDTRKNSLLRERCQH
jgi:hypothetical protein